MVQCHYSLEREHICNVWLYPVVTQSRDRSAIISNVGGRELCLTEQTGGHLRLRTFNGDDKVDSRVKNTEQECEECGILEDYHIPCAHGLFLYQCVGSVHRPPPVAE